mmetsp:Transcript_46250/g.153308  ORF Transcript_46250/g.153308 Transcript_46250/m.153308 type:complete len:222 (+) Transcript_46250:174-839(+)
MLCNAPRKGSRTYCSVSPTLHARDSCTILRGPHPAAVRRRRARRHPLELGHLRLGFIHPLLHLLLLGAHIRHHLTLAHPRVDLRREGDVAQQVAVPDARPLRRAHVQHAVPLPQHPEHARLVRHLRVGLVDHRHSQHCLLRLRRDAVQLALEVRRAAATPLSAHELPRPGGGRRQRWAHTREATDGVQLDAERGEVVGSGRGVVTLASFSGDVRRPASRPT